MFRQAYLLFYLLSLLDYISYCFIDFCIILIMLYILSWSLEQNTMAWKYSSKEWKHKTCTKISFNLNYLSLHYQGLHMTRLELGEEWIKYYSKMKLINCQSVKLSACKMRIGLWFSTDFVGWLHDLKQRFYFLCML